MATTLFTVPGGRVYIVRSVQILTNHASTAQTWVLSVFNGSVTFEWGRWVVPAQQTVNLDVRLALVAGDQLRATRVTSGVTGTVTVTGYDLIA